MTAVLSRREAAVPGPLGACVRAALPMTPACRVGARRACGSRGWFSLRGVVQPTTPLLGTAGGFPSLICLASAKARAQGVETGVAVAGLGRFSCDFEPDFDLAPRIQERRGGFAPRCVSGAVARGVRSSCRLLFCRLAHFHARLLTSTSSMGKYPRAFADLVGILTQDEFVE